MQIKRREQKEKKLQLLKIQREQQEQHLKELNEQRERDYFPSLMATLERVCSIDEDATLRVKRGFLN
jgi:hypothetical protein